MFLPQETNKRRSKYNKNKKAGNINTDESESMKLKAGKQINEIKI